MGLVGAKSVAIGLSKYVGKEANLSRIGVTCANGADSSSGVACDSEFGPFEALTLRLRLNGILPGLGVKVVEIRVDRWP